MKEILPVVIIVVALFVMISISSYFDSAKEVKLKELEIRKLEIMKGDK